MKPVIPIVFATNNAYVPYLGVTLQSLIAHSSPENHYQIYVFHTNLTHHHQEQLLDMAENHVTIEMVQIDETMSRKELYVSEYHFSVETIFRFFIPELLPQYDKVLYLDCDIIILQDIAELYDTDLGDCILGVAETGSWKTAFDWKTAFSQRLDVERDDLFNAGVILISCKQFSQEQIKDKCLALLEEDWKREEVWLVNPDQDALTIVCQGKIAKFPQCWNFEWHWQPELDGGSPQSTWTETQQKSYRELKKNINIIHYTSSIKPWNSPEKPLAEHFWKYARQTIFYEKILFNQIRVGKTYKKNGLKPELFPWGKVPLGCDLVLYGGGERGQDYAPQLLRTPLCRLVAICDQHPELVPELGVPVISKEKLKTTAFDYIFITIYNEKIAQAVRNDLLELGVPREKILLP